MYLRTVLADWLDQGGTVWAISLLPSTAKTATSRRLVTISVGKLEVAYVVVEVSENDLDDDGKGIGRWWVFNVDTASLAPEEAQDAITANYASEGVSQLEFTEEEVAAEMATEEFRVSARALVERLAKGGNTPYGRFHSHELVRLAMGDELAED